MPASNTKFRVLIAVTAVLSLVWTTLPAAAQTCIGYDPFSSIIPGVEVLRRTAEGDMHGLVDKRVPFVCPPRFQAEVRARALFMQFSGGLTNETTDQTSSLTGDLGYEEQGIVIQSMVRLQFSRVSLRGVYDAYLRTFRGRGAGGRLEWPGFYYGFDFDLYNTPSLRFGVDMDVYPNQPSFNVRQIPGVVPSTSVSILASRPATWGLHLVWNPINCGSLQGSFETRARRSLRSGSKIDEIEVAAGVLTPQTVLGEIGLRGGYRYTKLELQGEGFAVKPNWSAWFREFVYYY